MVDGKAKKRARYYISPHHPPPLAHLCLRLFCDFLFEKSGHTGRRKEDPLLDVISGILFVQNCMSRIPHSFQPFFKNGATVLFFLPPSLVPPAAGRGRLHRLSFRRSHQEVRQFHSLLGQACIVLTLAERYKDFQICIANCCFKSKTFLICIFFAGDDDDENSFPMESGGGGEDANEDDWSLSASALTSQTGGGGGCAREARRRVNNLIRRLKVRGK